MNDAERALKDWAARSVDQLLEELADLGRRARGGESLRRPFITLSLRSGRALDGWVLDLHRGAGGSTLLLQPLGADGRGPSWDVAHVPMTSVEAVTVRDVPGLERPPDDAPAAPTRLELGRRAAAAGEALSTAVGAPIRVEVDVGEGEAALGALDGLLRTLQEVVVSVCGDAAGREALRAKVKSFRLSAAGEARVTLEGAVVSVQAPLSWNRRVGAAQLERELEALL